MKGSYQGVVKKSKRKMKNLLDFAMELDPNFTSYEDRFEELK